jgi:hypothetical protein
VPFRRERDIVDLNPFDADAYFWNALEHFTPHVSHDTLNTAHLPSHAARHTANGTAHALHVTRVALTLRLGRINKPHRATHSEAVFMADAKKVDLVMESITVTLKKKDKRGEKKMLIKEMFATCKGGHVTALMGPSGVGATFAHLGECVLVCYSLPAPPGSHLGAFNACTIELILALWEAGVERFGVERVCYFIYHQRSRAFAGFKRATLLTQ